MNIPYLIKLLIKFLAILTATYIANTASAAKEDDVSNLLAGNDKIYLLLVIVLTGSFSGCTPDLTAIMKHRDKKLFFKYCCIALIFPLIITIIVSIIMLLIPEKLVSLFIVVSNVDVLKRYSAPLYYLSILIAPSILLDGLIMIAKRPFISSLCNVFGDTVSYLISLILYKTIAKTQPEKIMLFSPIGTAISFTFISILVYYVLQKSIFSKNPNYNEI